MYGAHVNGYCCKRAMTAEEAFGILQEAAASISILPRRGLPRLGTGCASHHKRIIDIRLAEIVTFFLLLLYPSCVIFIRYVLATSGKDRKQVEKEKKIEKVLAGVDMTRGNPYVLLLKFSSLMLIGNVFQQFYNMVDSIVVGNFVGEKALAAVGTGFPIMFMLVSLFLGIGIGATILISQFYGAKDNASVAQTVDTMYTASMVVSIPLTVIGVLVSRPLLTLINVPDDGTLDMAVQYLVIIFIGMLPQFGFNVNLGILQGLGDSKTSLLFLIVANIANIGLDLLFTLVFHWGVIGVAVATVMAQFIAWIYGIIYINRHYTLFRIRPFGFSFRKDLFCRALKLGLPSSVQNMLFSIGAIVFQRLVNGYGSDFIAGFNGANKIDTFAFMPLQSFANASTTFTGQNVGAKDVGRIKRGVTAALVISCAACVIICALIYPLSDFFMKLFNDKPAVVESGVLYLRSVLPFYPLLALLFIYSGALRGTGETMVPMIASFIALWFARVPSAYLIADRFGRNFIYFSYPIGWVIGSAVVAAAYYSGRWERKVFKFQPAHAPATEG